MLNYEILHKCVLQNPKDIVMEEYLEISWMIYEMFILKVHYMKVISFTFQGYSSSWWDYCDTENKVYSEYPFINLRMFVINFITYFWSFTKKIFEDIDIFNPMLFYMN